MAEWCETFRQARREVQDGARLCGVNKAAVAPGAGTDTTARLAGAIAQLHGGLAAVPGGREKDSAADGWLSPLLDAL
jgi:ADP-ribosylglycohydrolase